MFKSENRAISFQTVWGSGGDIDSLTESGVIVNGNSAFGITAFFSAVSLISDTISTLPVDAFIRFNGERRPFRPKPVWIDQPDVDMTRQAHYGQLVTSLLVYGNSYTRIFRDGNGEVVNLVVLDPTTVEVTRSTNGRKIFKVQGEKQPLTSDDVIHIVDLAVPGSLIGLSRVDKLKESLGIAFALQGFAGRFFANGLSSDVIISAPPSMTNTQAKDLIDGFNSRHKGFRKAHKAGILTGGATAQNLSLDPEKSQVLESRRFVVEEIARSFNIPLNMLGVPGTQSYASVEQNNLQFISHTLRPILEKIEWAYSRLIQVETAFIKFNFNALLRGDLASRAAAYSTLTQAGIFSVNQALALEDLPAVEGGDAHRVPLANIDLVAAGLTADDMKINMAQKLINAGFNPNDVLVSLGLPAVAHTGLPSTQLQQVAQIDPANPESVYGVN